MSLRADLQLIVRWIRPGSRVLDLGCGDGALLGHLRDHLDVSGYGLEIDTANIVSCVKNGIDVLQSDLNEGLSEFDPDSFDYVVMTQTLQAIHHPDRLLHEMLRVGQQGIVTFPNFGHWRNRVQLMLNGRMPVTRHLPNQWFDTPNIHLCTIKDFETLCKKQDIRIEERAVVDICHQAGFGMRLMPSLLAEIALYRFQRGHGARNP